MRYLLFEYGELPFSVIDLPEVEYDYSLNLNVLKSTKEPAIDNMNNVSTQTMTKTYDEVNDTDQDSYVSMATQTLTLVDVEQSDADNNIHTMLTSLITMTTTRVEMESTDQD